MPYTIKNARPVLLSYLGLSEQTANFIAGTDKWGILFEMESLKCVIFIMPLGENTSSPKVYFDIRDSGAEKFVAAWRFAEQNDLKFFCLGVKDENQKYKEHVISVEADINTVLKVSGLENGRRSGSGTQLNIPSNLLPNGNITRGKSNKFDIFFSVIKKEYLFTYLEVFDNRLFQFIKAKEKNLSDELNNEINLPSTHPVQLILYGVPGSGKSYTIAMHLEELGITKENASEYTKRVVFHPEYTNADFVGQILPRSDTSGTTISYPFVPGPFTQLLALAYTHKNQNYALIIEEINRGNAAAIFGELFQLLDRLDKDEDGTSNDYKYTSGWSSYPVTNDSINHAIRNMYEECENEPTTYPGFDPFIPKENFEHYKENIGIRLPPNFSIFATMNTSDQNVFKLDNAFKRRFDLELIPNVFGGKDGKLTQEEINQRDAEIEGFGFTWNNFREAVNEIITSDENEFDISSFADRQIGCWFVKAEDKKISRKTFLNKVLEYLWDDVCGGESEIFFNPDYKTLAELIADVEKENKTDIFSKDLQEKINSKKKSE